MKAEPHRLRITLVVAVLASSLLILHVRPSSAQQTDARGLNVVNIRTEDGKEVRLYDKSYALVVGVSDYTAGWPKLPGVKSDAEAVSAALERHGFLVTLVMNPDHVQLDKSFKEFISANGRNVENRLLFYFAGHGHTVKQSYGEEMGYIVPTDAPNPNLNQNGFLDKALSMRQMELYAESIQSKHALFLFDSCFSGSLFALTRAVPESISYKTTRHVRQFITSGSADEQVPDRSIFRRQFVEALEGEGDVNGDGYVTGTELGEFLQDKVVNYSRNAQHPQYGKIRHPNLDKGDFVFALPTKATGTTAKPASTSSTPAVPTYDFTVRLNTPSGKIEYPTGNGDSVVTSFSNGVAVLRGLRPGTYRVKIKPDDPTFEVEEVSLEVSDKSMSREIELVRKLTKWSFDWSSMDDWELPSGWRVTSGKISVNGSGLALPRDKSFRHYVDFQLLADVKMVNGIAASFALRAKDTQNYYLIQLTGPNADEPYVLRGFIVKNNTAQRLPRQFSIRNISDVLKPDKFFRLKLTMEESRIEVKVEHTERAGYSTLGDLYDPGDTYKVGAVGIVARDNEQNEIGLFKVCTPICGERGATDTTGAIAGQVTDRRTGEGIADALVQIINSETGIPSSTRSDTQGRFSQGGLKPGLYTVRISAKGFKTYEVKEQRVFLTEMLEMLPPPALEPEQ